MRDAGRADVYAAETAAFEGTAYESLTPFDELLGRARIIESASFWPHGPIRVARSRSDAESSTTRQQGSERPIIRLAAPQMTPATLVHEFAHVLAGVGHGHDGRFRRAHVDLVGYVFGDEPANWLLEAYAASGLPPGDRSWPPPPLRPGAGGPIAL